MIEHSILKLFLTNKEMYTKYYRYLSTSYIKENYKDVYRLLLCLDKYYTKSTESFCSLTSLEAEYLSSYPMIKDVDRQLLSLLLESISNADIDGNVVEYLSTHRNRALASELAVKYLEVSEGRATLEQAEEIKSKFDVETLHKPLENQFVSWDLEELYENQVATGGLRWRLQWLNKSLGSLRKGDFGFIFARPETGKTTFLASEVSYFATQTERPILWCNNEEGGGKVMLRCYQAMLGITHSEFKENRPSKMAEFMEMGGKNIHIYDDASMTSRSIEALCRQLNPSLIIFDQLDKVKGFPEDRDDLKLGAIYQWARELAKQYAPVIGVTQADGTGEGVKWLHMGHVANAKTAKQAEADFILGIGKSNDEGLGEVRFLNISKNKLAGDEDSEPAMRHGKGEVLIKPEIARYVDL